MCLSVPFLLCLFLHSSVIILSLKGQFTSKIHDETKACFREVVGGKSWMVLAESHWFDERLSQG